MSFSDILEIERARVRRERVVFDTVFERLKNRINSCVRVKATSCLYEIPGIIPGYPLVQIEKTMAYLIKRLVKEGFICFPVSNVHLFVTWDPEDIRKLDKIMREKNNPSKTNIDVNRDAGLKSLERENEDFIQSMLDSKLKQGIY